MIEWIISNIGTITVAVLLAAAVAAVIVVLIKNKKKGKSLCGGNCGHCAMGCSCHKE